MNNLPYELIEMIYFKKHILEMKESFDKIKKVEKHYCSCCLEDVSDTDYHIYNHRTNGSYICVGGECCWTIEYDDSGIETDSMSQTEKDELDWNFRDTVYDYVEYFKFESLEGFTFGY